MSREQAIAEFRDDLHHVRFGAGDDYLLVQTDDGTVIMHGGDPKREGKLTASKDGQGRSTAVLAQEALKNSDTGVIFYTALKPGKKAPQAKISYIARFRPWGMIFIAGDWFDDVDAIFYAVWLKLGLMAGGVLAVTILIAYLIGRDIVGSLSSLKTAMGRLAAGDHNLEVPGIGRRDEVADMAAAVQVFKDHAIEVEQLKVQQKALEARAVAEKREAIEKVAGDFELSVADLVNRLASASSQMETTASSLNGTATTAIIQATAVAAASEQASTNVQAVASAAEELAASVGDISKQVVTSSEVVTRAAADAERTNRLVGALAEAATQIGAVTDMISEIASRTNLLALNATIEAARAGDAGKGFAVVASEVKSLASQTAKATDEISRQISNMQNATDATVGAIRSIGTTISQLSEITTTIASALEEQTAATEEIARNVQQAAAGEREVAENIVGVMEAAKGTGTAAGDVFASAQEFSEQSRELREQVRQFLGIVRAA